jgi:threonylcarbamoyladenosine tRNA methylthiotransferase MtaB
VKTSLYELIGRILERVPALERLRLSSIEPLEVTPEIVNLVSTHPRMAHHFHVPLQSGSRRVLREMRRPYQPDFYSNLARSIREKLPDAAIGADVMVGFPGETDEEFTETFRLIDDSPLTYLHVFPYSARPGTPAAALESGVPPRVAQFRAKTLRRLIARKNAEFRQRMIGQVLDVLVLQPENALSTNFIRVRVAKELPVNEWTSVKISGVEEAGLRAS